MIEQPYVIVFFKALVVTDIVEIPLVWYLLSQSFRRTGKPVVLRQIIAAAFFANMATLPFLWFVYPEFLDFSSAVALGEATALVGETLLYYFLLGASLRVAFLISLVANGASVLVGFILMPPF
ncbi:MAG: hypothetical protein V2B20_27815 [Pseudomonadota bacterium]